MFEDRSYQRTFHSAPKSACNELIELNNSSYSPVGGSDRATVQRLSSALYAIFDREANQPVTLSSYKAWGASCSARFALQ